MRGGKTGRWLMVLVLVGLLVGLVLLVARQEQGQARDGGDRDGGDRPIIRLY